MPDEVIRCPSCRHELRVPEYLLGQTVQCPECEGFFTAPERRPEGGLTEPAVAAAPPGVADAALQRKLIGYKVLVPALFLFLGGLVGAVISGFFSYALLVNEAQSEAAIRKELQRRFEEQNVPAEDRAQILARLPGQIRTLQTWFPIFLGMSAVVCLGALAMMAMRFYPLAVLASLLAMVNLTECCCLFGVPTGLWALITLLNPEVRAQFS